MAVRMNYNAAAENTRRNLLREERKLPHDGSVERTKKLTPAEHRRRIELQQRKDPRLKCCMKRTTSDANP